MNSSQSSFLDDCELPLSSDDEFMDAHFNKESIEFIDSNNNNVVSCKTLDYFESDQTLYSSALDGNEMDMTSCNDDNHELIRNMSESFSNERLMNEKQSIETILNVRVMVKKLRKKDIQSFKLFGFTCKQKRESLKTIHLKKECARSENKRSASLYKKRDEDSNWTILSKKNKPRKIKAFTCKICHEQFAFKNLLYAHKKICSDLLLSKKNKPRKIKAFTCKICHQQFAFKNLLYAHKKLCSNLLLSKKNKSRKIKAFTCKICHQQFAFKNLLYAHKKICSEPFVPVPQKKMRNRRESSDKRLKKVETDRSHCDSTSLSFSDRKWHDIMLYLRCYNCSRYFINTRALKQHRKSSSCKFMNRIPCPVCSTEVANTYFTRHMRIHFSRGPKIKDLPQLNSKEKQELVKILNNKIDMFI